MSNVPDLAKIVPPSKLSEWKGLDRIAAVVHGMKCIWREQEKDDIGIDGEIELCAPRLDGEGLVGTGKIVKVQSKSGASYVIKDQAASFASPVAEKDLAYWQGLNVPVIYVVFHPGQDALYWKDIKAYLRERPDALAAPHRIEFDKTSDRFDESAYPALCAICEQAPERVSMDVKEVLYTNLLEIVRLPDQVFVTPVLPEKQPHFHERLTGIIPPYVYRQGMLMTLTDPVDGETALKSVVDPAVEPIDMASWLAQGVQEENDLRALLNSTLHRHLRRLGLSFHKDTRRYFFNEGLAEDSPLRRTWTSARTGRTQPRLVAKRYAYGALAFYRHLALEAHVVRFGGAWAISVSPAVHFTTDGTRLWEGETANSFAIRARAKEYNGVYLNNVLFWANQMARGEATFTLNIGPHEVAEVNGIPPTAEASFGIRPGGKRG